MNSEIHLRIVYRLLLKLTGSVLELTTLYTIDQGLSQTTWKKDATITPGNLSKLSEILYSTFYSYFHCDNMF